MTTTTHQADNRGLVVRCPKCGQGNRQTYERLGSDFRCGQCKSPLPSPAEPVDIPGTQVLDQLIGHSALPVLVDFWAPWCGPCKMVAPELVKVARQSSGRWLIAKVNTEVLQDVAARFDIRSIPTLAAFRSGREIGRQAGALPAAGILQFMQRMN